MENGTVPISVKEAAERLGISPRGVRQRITRGRLKATQINGEWVVYLGEPVPENNVTGNTASFRSPKERGMYTRRSPVPTPEMQLQAVMDTWLAPLTKTIQEQAEEIGRLKAENEMLRVQLTEDDHISREPRGFWQWLVGR